MNSNETLEVGKAVMGQMAAQSDLLLSLSTAVIGGTVALLLQSLLKSDADAGLINGKNWLYGGLTLHFLFVVFAYLHLERS